MSNLILHLAGIQIQKGSKGQSRLFRSYTRSPQTVTYSARTRDTTAYGEKDGESKICEQSDSRLPWKAYPVPQHNWWVSGTGRKRETFSADLAVCPRSENI